MLKDTIGGILLVFMCVGTVGGQTFLDRQNPDAFRIVCYNMFWDDLFDHPNHAPFELQRMINAVDADVYCFQECSSTSSSVAVTTFNNLAPLPGGASWQAHKGRNQLIISRHNLSMQATDVPNGQRGIAMALIDLPDGVFENDLYILNNHFPCCTNEAGRIHEAQVIIEWIDDARYPGGNVDLPPGTAISVLGDLNAVDGPGPIDILLDGYNGLTSDLDDTSSSDVLPFHNVTEPEIWTWRDDSLPFDPGVLDFVLFTDSVLKLDYRYVLNPFEMSAMDLAASGLQATDFMLDKDNPKDNVIDHLPIVADFVPVQFFPGQAYKRLDGLVAAGGLSETNSSDDQYLQLMPSPTTNPFKQKVDIIVQSEAPVGTATEFAFRVEAKLQGGPSGDVVQEVRLLNYSTMEWDSVDSRPLATADVFVQLPVLKNMQNYLHPITSEVTSRVIWESPAFASSSFFWDVEVDQLGWVVDGVSSARLKNATGKGTKKIRTGK